MRTTGRRRRERPVRLAAALSGAATAALVLAAAPAQAVGVLSISGTGATVNVSQSPGRFGSSLGATTLTVSDTTLTTNGWAVTATYAPPVSGTALGGANVAVSGSNVVPDALGGVASANVVIATDAPLSSPVTVARTAGTVTGAGVTSLVASLKIRVPQTAVIGQTFGALVTYTVASIR